MAGFRDAMAPSRYPPSALFRSGFDGNNLADTAPQQESATSKMKGKSKPGYRSSSSIPQTCSLFKLPGEIRNMIYRLVLLKESAIVVTPTGYDRSGGLLVTCKDLRAESICIYYAENDFTHIVEKFNSEPLMRFCSGVQAIEGPSICCNITFRRYWSRPLHWRNLMAWLEAYHSQKICLGFHSPQHLSTTGRTEMRAYLVGTMFETALKMRQQPWAFVKDILEVHRPSLALIDSRWNE